MERVVATSESKRGGPCAAKDCSTFIHKGEFIAKVATQGDTTRYQNGPGYWVCRKCAEKHPWTNNAVAERGVTFDLFFPDIENDLDLQAKVPVGFVKALKHSDYTRWAYWLGYQRGKEDGATSSSG